MNNNKATAVPQIAAGAVLVSSEPLPADTPQVKGYDFNNGVDYKQLLGSYLTSGFQASNFGHAVNEINRMLAARSRDAADADVLCDDEFIRRRHACTIFLGFTSNMISSGVREQIRYLVEHSMVDCVVTTAGGVEEDLIKCLAPTYVGSFELPGRDLRAKGINRIGNLLAPNDNYCKFEDWVTPILDRMLEEQQQQSVVWSPSRIAAHLGREINDRNSVLYWAQRNHIPVFSPALTDGSLGDMIYFHSFKQRDGAGLLVDIVSDLKRINTMAMKAERSGIVILGGGLVKHHICNANLMRNGADFSVFVNTGQEYDGSDSGARPDEAISWGKIRATAAPVKVYADATLVFPLLVAETFAQRHQYGQSSKTQPVNSSPDSSH